MSRCSPATWIIALHLPRFGPICDRQNDELAWKFVRAACALSWLLSGDEEPGLSRSSSEGSPSPISVTFIRGYKDQSRIALRPMIELTG